MTFSKVRIRFYLGYFFLKFPLIHSFLSHLLMMLICSTYFILLQRLWDDSAQIKVYGKAFFHSRYVTIITSNIFNELQASAMAFIFINSSKCTFLLLLLLSDATVVVGDVSDENSILNAAFINQKVNYDSSIIIAFTICI